MSRRKICLSAFFLLNDWIKLYARILFIGKSDVERYLFKFYIVVFCVKFGHKKLKVDGFFA